MKYSHNYSKLGGKGYTTIRRYNKGKLGDVVLEVYPKGFHYSEIIGIEREVLERISNSRIFADTDKSSRKEVYELFQSFYEKPIDFNKERFYIYYLKRIFGDKCGMCNIGTMNHLKLYYWKCTHCGFSYQIDPAGKTPKITILNRGKNYGKEN